MTDADAIGQWQKPVSRLYNLSFFFFFLAKESVNSFLKVKIADIDHLCSEQIGTL